MIRIAGMGTGLCYAANNTRRFHACSSETNGPRRTILDDRTSAILYDRKVGVQRTETNRTMRDPRTLRRPLFLPIQNSDRAGNEPHCAEQRENTYKTPIIPLSYLIPRLHLHLNNY